MLGGFKTPNQIVVVRVDKGIFLFLPLPLLALQLVKKMLAAPKPDFASLPPGMHSSVG